LTYRGWLTHISGHPSAALASATGRAQDSESTPAKDRRSTAGPRNQNKAAITNTQDDNDDDDEWICIARHK